MVVVNKKRRLRSWPNRDITSVKKRIAKVLAQVEHGKIELPNARLLVQGAAVLVNAIKVEKEFEIEKRLAKIEERLLVSKGDN